MQPINSFGQRLALHRNRIAELNSRVFIRAHAPDFSVRHETAPNFPAIHQRAMVFDRDIGQRDALFDLGSLADISQLQIVLCKNSSAKCKTDESKSKRL